MHKIRRRPKQNFNINFEKIYDSSLLSTEKQILISALQFHKANCKNEYKNLLNGDLTHTLSISEPTLIKHRNNLEKEKFFNLKRIRRGNSYLLQYRFNWTKLKKVDFISDIDKTKFQPMQKKSKKEYFKKGDSITEENYHRLTDDVLYSIKYRERVPTKNEFYSWVTKKILGKSLKSWIKTEQKRQQREKDNIDAVEFKFIEQA